MTKRRGSGRPLTAPPLPRPVQPVQLPVRSRPSSGEHHVHGSLFWQAAPVLLGEHARTAAQPGTCQAAGDPVWAGDRIADVPGGGIAHLFCLGQP